MSPGRGSRGTTCRRRFWNPDHFYCRDCWFDLLDELGDRIERIADRAAEFYIGRTCDPDARRDEHHDDAGRDQLLVLHWADDIGEICAIEEALIRDFEEFDNLANRTDDSCGGGRPDLRNCVYVSWRALSTSRHGRAFSGLETGIPGRERQVVLSQDLPRSHRLGRVRLSAAPRRPTMSNEKPRSPNDDRADVKNDNNPKHDADLENRRKLGHPNVPEPKPKEGSK